MRFLAVIGALAIIVVIGAAVFFFGGFDNVAASEQDNAAVAWALQHVREASIDRHGSAAPSGSLDDAAIIRSGAHAFLERGCVNCHGGPGVTWANFSEGPTWSSRSQGRGGRRATCGAVLGHQERYPNDGDAEFRCDGCPRSGDLVDRRVPQEASDRVGRRLQDLEHVWVLSSPSDGGTSCPGTLPCPTVRQRCRGCGGWTSTCL